MLWRIVVGLAGAALIATMLAEFFVTFLVPRRVKRDPRIARGLFRMLWRPWRWVASRLSSAAGDTMLGFFGPLALIVELMIWTLALMIGFAALEWSFGSRLGPGAAHAFGDDVYFSSGQFLSAAVTAVPVGSATRALSLAEAATGVGVLFTIIGYLPAVYGAFSRREIAVSQLAPRAGSPPTALRLITRSAETGRWQDLRDYLKEAEAWAAELMETHLSYPQLAYYRSQHVNQNWLAALSTIVDTSAAVLAAVPEGDAISAENTYAIGRHAFADLAHQFRVRRDHSPRRLTDEAFSLLRDAFESENKHLVDRDTMRRRLDGFRAEYEPNALGLSEWLGLPLSEWVASDVLQREQRRRVEATPPAPTVRTPGR
jgi:hypothetical protein